MLLPVLNLRIMKDVPNARSHDLVIGIQLKQTFFLLGFLLVFGLLLHP